MSISTSSVQVNRNTRYNLNNGQYIPVVAYGTYLVPAADAADLVYKALKAGYRHIDTAVGYNNQKECAQGIVNFLKDHPDVSRSDIWYTTKLTNAQQGYEETHKALREISAEVSDLIEYVDLILLHSPLTSKEKRIASWLALQEVIRDPSSSPLHLKSIGVSNFGKKHIEELFAADGFLIKPVVNQLELHPWLPRLELRKFLIENNILLEAYSPLTQGAKLQDPELLELERKSGIPKAEILLKWSYLQGFIVLVKSVNEERIKSNLEVLPDSPYGKIDLDINIVNDLNKPDLHEVFTWGHKDPTLCP